MQTNLDILERAHQAAREGATHEEAKPENDKDTRALEQSYLARGQSMRIEQLRTDVAAVRAMPLRSFPTDGPVALGAVVQVQTDDERRALYFLAPQGGGTLLADGTVQVVTPMSPLGRALMGKRVGDSCEVQTGGKQRELEILSIA